MNKKYPLLVILSIIVCCIHAQSLSSARALFNEGKYSEALPVFRKFVRQSPSNANYNYWYGACCVETGSGILAMPYLEKAAQRKVLEAYPYLIRCQAGQYLFDEAVETYDDYIRLLKSRKKPADEAISGQQKMQTASLMLKGTEDLCVVDSFVITKDRFLEAYRTGPDAGTLETCASFFNDKSQKGTMHRNELGQKLYLSLNDNGRLNICTIDRLLDKWSSPLPVAGLQEEGDNNYPFMMPDGITLYYANNSSESLGGSGYDIYVTRLNAPAGRFLKPENMGMPYNSPANDYMMVIDEFNNLGWFASDRYQPEGKVCVYVFVPNGSRRTFDYNDSTSVNIRQTAMLHSIRNTWKDGRIVHDAVARMREIASQSRKPAPGHAFTFVIDDHNIYHKLEDFRSKEARSLFMQWVRKSDDLESTRTRMAALRSAYIAGNEEQRQNLTPELLGLEKREEQMCGELDKLELSVRASEKEQIH